MSQKSHRKSPRFGGVTSDARFLHEIVIELQKFYHFRKVRLKKPRFPNFRDLKKFFFSRNRKFPEGTKMTKMSRSRLIDIFPL